MLLFSITNLRMVELDRLEKSYCVFTYCTKTLRPVPEQEGHSTHNLKVGACASVAVHLL